MYVCIMGILVAATGLFEWFMLQNPRLISKSNTLLVCASA